MLQDCSKAMSHGNIEVNFVSSDTVGCGGSVVRALAAKTEVLGSVLYILYLLFAFVCPIIMRWFIFSCFLINDTLSLPSLVLYIRLQRRHRLMRLRQRPLQG